MSNKHSSACKLAAMKGDKTKPVYKQLKEIHRVLQPESLGYRTPHEVYWRT